ncbi:cyclin-D-binding Myb-like transcription factor 1 isoform X1 [Acropora millepora]|uniref:cyclin-D-binding Myb-like transcription factor 1 isoform X1 n=1 Tax=Acropora millepora TaxID=45264 RepID=UPI001CF576D4|nr:cyclin-D-binding Myb-like transcription factor 1 isoform X1 [Acropora millepora]
MTSRIGGILFSRQSFTLILGVAYKGILLQFTIVLPGFTTRPTIWDDINKGSWADDEIDRLKEAVHRVTDTPEGGSVPFKGFSWQAVADIVKTRNSHQCRSQWLYRLCFREDTIKSGKRWSAEDDRKLITRLYKSGVTEECDVDWMDVKSEFDINYSPHWCIFKWNEIKKRVPDYHLLGFEDAVDYLYQKYGKTARDSE